MTKKKPAQTRKRTIGIHFKVSKEEFEALKERIIKFSKENLDSASGSLPPNPLPWRDYFFAVEEELKQYKQLGTMDFIMRMIKKLGLDEGYKL